MEDPHLAAIEYSVLPHNWSGGVRVRSQLDGSVINSGVARYRSLSSKHLEVLDRGAAGDESVYLLARTVQSRVEMAQAARTRAYGAAGPLKARRESSAEPEVVGQELAFDVVEGRRACVEKVVAIYTSRDRAIADPLTEARDAVTRAGRFEELLMPHARAWSGLWRRCDVEIDPPGEEQLISRVHIFHLLQSVSPNSIDLDVGVPARGLHGEAYRGHIFWDELFIFPFLNLHIPDITRSLLLYRYRRLAAARRLARQAGFAGAMFPWQSGSNGKEETQEVHLNPNTGEWGPDLSRRQRHVNLAIAYNVWQYYLTTGDREFMERYGAEMMLEIARFFVSLTTLNRETGRYEIHGVMGPDEYHEKYPDSDEHGLRNNAYTNVMVVWLLDRAAEILELLGPEQRAELCGRIGLEDRERELWGEIGAKMTVCFHDGVLSQFEGYQRLKEFDWDGYRKKYGNIARLDRILKAENDSPDNYRLSKQADALMLYYLLPPKELKVIFQELGYEWNDEIARRTLDYYRERTSHGSTLSNVVHASVMDRVDRAAAWKLFVEALQSDVADVQGGTTPEGIHLGAMSGTVDIVLRHYAGIDTAGDVISFFPRLPPQLKGLRLRVRHRGHWYQVRVQGDRFFLEVGADGVGPLKVQVLGVDPKLKPGDRYECRLPQAASR
jgi:trehalose/maltose hydrolase-like predicted phosphorylase